MPYTYGFDPTTRWGGEGGGTRMRGRAALFTRYIHDKAYFLHYTHDCHTLYISQATCIEISKNLTTRPI